MKGEMREVLYLEINILPQFITGLLFCDRNNRNEEGGGAIQDCIPFWIKLQKHFLQL